jgi:hypothetical protein
MLFSELFRRCRWGAGICVLTLSLALVGCGDDDADGANNTNPNNNTADVGAPDGGLDDAGHDADSSGDPDADDPDASEPDAEPDADGPDASDPDATSDPDADASEPDASGDGIEIAGTYEDDFDSEVVISDDAWETFPPDSDPWMIHVVDYDNDQNYAVSQNPDDADFGAGKYNKEVWTEPDGAGVFYHCTADFGLDTEQEARDAVGTADDSDPASGGCGDGDFPWTKLTPM